RKDRIARTTDSIPLMNSRTRMPAERGSVKAMNRATEPVNRRYTRDNVEATTMPPKTLVSTPAARVHSHSCCPRRGLTTPFASSAFVFVNSTTPCRPSRTAAFDKWVFCPPGNPLTRRGQCRCAYRQPCLALDVAVDIGRRTEVKCEYQCLPHLRRSRSDQRRSLASVERYQLSW